MKATVSNYAQSPRKVRLVSDLVKGKSIEEALTILKFEMRRASDPIAKLIASAAANAENKGERAADLVVKSITVDKGIVLKRFMPRAFGRGAPIRRRRSHVTVLLARKNESVKAAKPRSAKKK